MAADEQSYIKSTAEQRLELIKSQLVSQAQQDSAIGRQMKTLKRKDLAAQIQPLVAQVQLKAGISEGVGKAQTPWGQAVAGRAGKMGTNTWNQKVNWMSGGNPTGQGSTVRYHTGRTTVLDPGAQWTTEGYVDNAKQMQEQARQMVIRSTQKDTGMVYNKVANSQTGESEWSGRKMQFGTDGTMTPVMTDAQKGQSLADRYKQRSKGQVGSLATVPPPPDIGG